MSEEKLTWDDEFGIGFYPADTNDQTYSDVYWQEYVKRAATPTGAALTRFRIGLVDKHIQKSALLDVGIGAGQFVDERRKTGGVTVGYDVNLHAVRWLVDRGLWFDPWWKRPVSASLWDSLEHMEKPDEFVRRVDQWLFVSLPIVPDGWDKKKIIAWKHWKPNEHRWFFTRRGFVTWALDQGFRLVEENRGECALGRQDIGTFVFRRV